MYSLSKILDKIIVMEEIGLSQSYCLISDLYMCLSCEDIVGLDNRCYNYIHISY